MAGQLPPDVLEDLMLMEAMNPGDGQGGMPGGFGDIGEEDDEAEAMNGMVELNFNAGAGLAAPIPAARVGIAEDLRPLADGADEQDQSDEDEDEEDDEEEYISVSIYLFFLGLLIDYNLRWISLCPVCYVTSWEDFGDKARKWRSHLRRTRRRGIIQVLTNACIGFDNAALLSLQIISYFCNGTDSM